MSLSDWFFPEQAQATHLRRLADQQRHAQQRRVHIESDKDYRLSRLEEDLGFVALVLGSLMEKLDSSGAVTRRDLKAARSELDAIDGIRDGRLNIALLKDRQIEDDVADALGLSGSSDESTDEEIARLKERLAELEKKREES